ncbi:MAG: ATP-binding protein [Bryobacteraceae bacterium]|jgi:two-component system phosphate regulon sensor histidine kinase PhoR
MTARIFLKFIAAVLIIMVVALTAIDFLSSRLAERAYVGDLKTDLSEKIALLQVMRRQKLITLTPETVRGLAQSAGGRLTFIARDGRVLLDSDADPAKMENHATRPKVREALQGRIGSSARASASVGIRFLYVAGPLEDGVIRLAVPLKQVEAHVSELRESLVLYTALAFLPGILLAAFLARYYSSRLGAAIHYASTLAMGNFKARLQSPGNDELGILGKQLNETGEKLQKMFEELQSEHVELEKLERIRKDFVINVSHELRTPLASIQGYTETLLDGALEDRENNVKFLNIIRQNAERLARLTADLLTLGRLELKTQKLQPASYYVNPLLEDCIATLRPMADKKRIDFLYEPAPESTEAFCDGEAMHQIMMNLLDNAIKYTPEGGHIAVFAHRVTDPGRGDIVEVGVRDTGIGIPAEELPRLFERFYRVDKARSRALGGTGLGLAIVKHLVRSLGGEVYVDSVANQGSTFRFTLPVQDPGSNKDLDIQDQLTV